MSASRLLRLLGWLRLLGKLPTAVGGRAGRRPPGAVTRRTARAPLRPCAHVPACHACICPPPRARSPALHPAAALRRPHTAGSCPRCLPTGDTTVTYPLSRSRSTTRCNCRSMHEGGEQRPARRGEHPGRRCHVAMTLPAAAPPCLVAPTPLLSLQVNRAGRAKLARPPSCLSRAFFVLFLSPPSSFLQAAASITPLPFPCCSLLAS